MSLRETHCEPNSARASSAQARRKPPIRDEGILDNPHVVSCQMHLKAAKPAITRTLAKCQPVGDVGVAASIAYGYKLNGVCLYRCVGSCCVVGWEIQTAVAWGSVLSGDWLEDKRAGVKVREKKSKLPRSCNQTVRVDGICRFCPIKRQEK